MPHIVAISHPAARSAPTSATGGHATGASSTAATARLAAALTTSSVTTSSRAPAATVATFPAYTRSRDGCCTSMVFQVSQA